MCLIIWISLKGRGWWRELVCSAWWCKGLWGGVGGGGLLHMYMWGISFSEFALTSLWEIINRWFLKKERGCKRLESFEGCCVYTQPITDTFASVAFTVYVILYGRKLGAIFDFFLFSHTQICGTCQLSVLNVSGILFFLFILALTVLF